MSASIKLFESERKRLFSLAYRMLGKVAEAEDVVQEAWIRFATAKSEIKDGPAFLTTIVTRLSLDHLKSARREREIYVGPWLPEPLVTAAGLMSEGDVEGLAGDITTAFLVALERLTPLERAVFLLHDAFEMDFEEVARILHRNSATCRKLASRARANLKREKPRFAVDPALARALADRFIVAARQGNENSLLSMLDQNAVLMTDGGGKLQAALRPITGREAIAGFIAMLARKAPAAGLASFEPVSINQTPGFRVTGLSARSETIAIEIGERGLVTAIYYVRNPDKLAHVGAGPNLAS